jgi:hypothetical protein
MVTSRNPRRGLGKASQMKQILSLLLLTVMLRVWWPDYQAFGQSYKAGTGILIDVGEDDFSLVRTDDGNLTWVMFNHINKTKWVEVKAEK